MSLGIDRLKFSLTVLLASAQGKSSCFAEYQHYQLTKPKEKRATIALQITVRICDTHSSIWQVNETYHSL